MAAEFDIDKLGYPVVNRADGIDWVIDGQHRTYALRKQHVIPSDGTIECEVYENLSEQQMADLFLGRNRSRPVTAFERFQVAVTAGYAREQAITEVVKATKLEIGKERARGCIFSVGALQRVYDRLGPRVLRRTLETLRDAYDGAPVAFGGAIIEGQALVYSRHHGINDQAVAAGLGKDRHGIHGLRRRAEGYRERLGRQQAECIAAATIDVCNQGQDRKDRLPSWWKY